MVLMEYSLLKKRGISKNNIISNSCVPEWTREEIKANCIKNTAKKEKRFNLKVNEEKR